MSFLFATACAAALGVAAIASAAAPTTRATFSNPVIAGFAPDPSVCRAGDDFYLANSSFTMRPGLPIYHSRDLAHWQLIGYAAGRDAGTSFVGSTTDGGIYAPTLRYHDGTFYLIVKNTTSGHNELYATRDPAGTWSDPKAIGPDWDGDIDPDLFFDADGSAYVARRIGIGDGSKANQFAWHFDPQTARVTSDKFPIWDGTGQHVWPEGGHLYRVGDFYYYQLAEGGTGNDHRVTIARKPVGKGLDDLSQTWTPCPANPVLFNDSTKRPEISATGHADLVEDAAGHWWATFLGERKSPRPDLGRETFLAPVAWRDGWPIFNGGRPITPAMTASVSLPGKPPTSRPSAIRDDFDASTLGLEWNWLRTIDSATFSLSESPGTLTLHGRADGLDSKSAVAWVGRRLRDKSVRVTTRLTFAPGDDAQVAGIDLFSTDASSAELIVCRAADGGREAIVRVHATRRISPTTTATTRATTNGDAVALPAGGAIDLQIELAGGRATFRASADGGATWQDVQSMAAGDAIAAPGFAGVYVGLHAVGAGATARFDDFAYEPPP